MMDGEVVVASSGYDGYGYGSFAAVWDENKGIANLWDNYFGTGYSGRNYRK
jgi:hypothetical protein